MRYIVLVTLLGLGCGGLVEEEVDSQSQGVAVVNGEVNLPAGQICHPTYLAGSGANSQAPVYSGFAVKKWGGAFQHNVVGTTHNANAYPNALTTPKQGTMAATYDCNACSDFHGAGCTQSNAISLAWNQTPTLQLVSGTRPDLWNTVSACWLDSIGHHSATGEHSWLSTYQSGGSWQWQLNVTGYPALVGSARCAWLGRNLGNVEWLHATPGNPHVSGTRPSQGACFLYDVSGEVDNGSVLCKRGFFWALEVSGSVTEARAYIVRY